MLHENVSSKELLTMGRSTGRQVSYIFHATVIHGVKFLPNVVKNLAKIYDSKNF